LQGFILAPAEFSNAALAIVGLVSLAFLCGMQYREFFIKKPHLVLIVPLIALLLEILLFL
jgi:hypothetical protein